MYLKAVGDVKEKPEMVEMMSIYPGLNCPGNGAAE